jgi:molybdopterin-guanine dinucleotide biosynthesis protein A
LDRYTAPRSVSAAILAGGRGTRLGGLDKSALTVGAQSILDRQLALLLDLVAHVFVVADDGARFAGAGVPVVADRIKGAGALGGLYTALVEAPTDDVLIVACDMPFLTRPFLAHLARVAPGADSVIPRDAGGQHPLCARYAARIAPLLEARLAAGVRKISDALDALDVVDLGPGELARFDPSGTLLLNVNTPADYERARAAAGPNA